MNCEQCGGICCGKQPTEDIFSLFLLPEEKIVMRASVPNIKIVDYGPFGYFETNGRCPCLEGGKCKIYLDRPLMCRCFPLMIYQDAAGQMGFDLSLCPQHNPGESTAALNTIEEVFNAFQISYQDFFSLLAMYFIKEIRINDVMNEMSLRDRNRLSIKQAVLRTIEARHQKMLVRPQLPVKWGVYFVDKAHKAYGFYKQHPNKGIIKTREMIKVMQTLISISMMEDAKKGVTL